MQRDTHDENAQTFWKMLGYTWVLPITKTWRAWRDTTRKRALVLQFKELEPRVTSTWMKISSR